MTHRAKVGPAELFDVIGAQQFCVLAGLGLREHHRLLDVGCGCLRGGRFFIPYLGRGNYCGLEPDTELLKAGMALEVGPSQIEEKRPQFYTFHDFRLTSIAGRFGLFDYVLAQSILSHTGPALLALVFQEAYGVLVDGGTFAATWFQGDEDETDEGWYPGRAMRYRDWTVSGLALDAGFSGLKVLDVKHPMGQTWFAVKKG